MVKTKRLAVRVGGQKSPREHTRVCRDCGVEFKTKYHAYCEACRVKVEHNRCFNVKDRKRVKDWLPAIKELPLITYASAAQAWGLGLGQESMGRLNELLHLGCLVSVGPGKFTIAT